MSESLSEDVPAAIRAFIDTSGAGDRDALLAAFTEDASVVDGGREFVGHEGVAAWDDGERIGKRGGLELLGVKPGTGDQQFVATVLAAGDGTQDLELTVRGDRVARLVVAP